MTVINDQNQLDLSLRESNALKGVALMLLLIHHLFYIQNGMYDDVTVHGLHIVYILSNLCKVCVAIFVFLSGYACGKTARIGSMAEVWAFYKRRFKKLFVNYWFIWLLFVPAGVFIFDRTFADVYKEPVVQNFLLDFFGLINATGQLGYNATWWFYSCIIMLYAMFPLFSAVVGRWPRSIYLLLAASFALNFAPVPFIAPIRSYLFPFVLGMALNSEYITHRFTGIYRLIGGGTSAVGIAVLVVLMLTVVFMRITSGMTFLWDTLISLLLALIYKSVHLSDRINLGLEFLGRHSFNIFLFHTFIYAYFFPTLIYWNRNPVVIFFTLLLSCVVISMAIERLKKLTGVDRI